MGKIKFLTMLSLTIIFAFGLGLNSISGVDSTDLSDPTVQIKNEASLPKTAGGEIAPLSIPSWQLANGGEVHFGYGETSAVISGALHANSCVSYSLRAMEDQTFIMTLNSKNGNAALGMSDDRGTVFLDPSSRNQFWNMRLPRTANYISSVCAFDPADEFVLQVIIPRRLNIAPGNTTVSFNASVKAYGTISFLIYAYKGQKMSVNVYSGATPAAFLRISGMEANQIYQDSSAMTPSWYAYAPQSQDYLIEVVAYDKAANYTLTAELR